MGIDLTLYQNPTLFTWRRPGSRRAFSPRMVPAAENVATNLRLCSEIQIQGSKVYLRVMMHEKDGPCGEQRRNEFAHDAYPDIDRSRLQRGHQLLNSNPQNRRFHPAPFEISLKATMLCQGGVCVMIKLCRCQDSQRVPCLSTGCLSLSSSLSFSLSLSSPLSLVLSLLSLSIGISLPLSYLTQCMNEIRFKSHPPPPNRHLIVYYY